MKDKNTLLLIVAIVVVVGLGFFVYKSAVKPGAKPEEEVTTQPGERIVPSPKVTVNIEKKVEEARKTRQETKLIEMATGLEKGTTTRSFNGTKYLLAAVASLPNPGVGKYYQGWVESRTATPARLAADRMALADTGEYALVFSSTQYDFFKYEKVVITLEQTDDDQPETAVLEGTF